MFFVFFFFKQKTAYYVRISDLSSDVCSSDLMEVVGLIEEPNLEAIAAQRPDLILGAKERHEALYEELSGIAPTVFTESSGTNWKEGRSEERRGGNECVSTCR